MSCPYCGSEIYVSDNVLENIFQYKTTPLVSTLCCSRPIRLKSELVFKSCIVNTNKLEDDWGTPFKRESLLGKYILLKSDEYYTSGTVYEITEDNPLNDWIKAGLLCFNRKSILFIGTKEEMKLISKKHLDVLKIIKERNRKNREDLKDLLDYFSNFNYSKYLT